ncbi:replication protein P [Psychrobacter phage vB_PmaS_Y8A]|nr:replication protein P [Psychrobacter phage vB_PmaS_Y8A]
MPDTAEIWAIALTDLRITGKELAVAQRKSMSLEWPPTAPADFLALGRTETASNYPDMKQAYLAAANGDYKHEVALETAKRVGSWELKTQPESVSYKSWQKHYVEVCEEHSRGADFKVPETHRVEHSHAPVQAGSEADKRISEKLAELRRMAV